MDRSYDDSAYTTIFSKVVVCSISVASKEQSEPYHGDEMTVLELLQPFPDSIITVFQVPGRFMAI
jgi:hypothetical protein